MGIENFFNSFKKFNSMGNKHINDTKKLSCKHLYLDFNSILYTIANNIEKSINYVLYANIINKIDEKCNNIMQKYHMDIKFSDNTDINLWCDEYHKYVKEHINDKFIINEIKNYIYYIIDNLLEECVLESLFISIDGIPHMAKIVEQKRRRNMTYIISNLKKKVYDKYSDSLDNTRLIYEKHKYIFNRSGINSISNFMNTLCLYLVTDEFNNAIKSRYCNIINIYVSPNNKHGEGEKKIINDIISNNRTNCVIFSPDSDIIILSALLKNILKYKNNTDSDISIIKHDSYNETCEILNISDFCHDIYIYIHKYIGNINLDKFRVVNDICFIFTLLGNDFIPKLESINIKTDIELLLDIYIYTLTILDKTDDMYITYYKNNKFMINYLSFSKYIEYLSRKEVILLKDRYLSNKYYNIKKLKAIFGKKVLIPHLTQYILFANFMYSLRNIKKVDDMTFFLYIKDRLNQLFNTDTNEELLLYLIDKFIKIENIKLTRINSLSPMTLVQMVADILLKHRNIKPQLGLYDKKYNVKDEYHQNNILKTFYHHDIKITKYDEEVYILLKNYNNKPSTNYEIGYVKLMSNNDKYLYKKSNIITDAQIYYKRYFNIDITNKNDIPKLNTIINEYVKGLFWIFDFYMNCHDTQTNTVSNWFYKYSHSPLLYHVSKYIAYKKNKIEWFKNIYKSLNTHNILKSNFITPNEYYIFINPIQKINKNNINKETYDKLVNNRNLYIDLDEIVDEIWNGNKTIIDTSYTFLNKGRLINKIEISYKKWKLLINNIDINVNSLLEI